jgi:hypothetical protein
MVASSHSFLHVKRASHTSLGCVVKLLSVAREALGSTLVV